MNVVLNYVIETNVVTVDALLFFLGRQHSGFLAVCLGSSPSVRASLWAAYEASKRRPIITIMTAHQFMVHLDIEEFAAICAVAKQAAILQGEDAIGALMKIGAFRVVKEVCLTAERIDHGNGVYEKMYRQNIEYEKKKYRKKNKQK